MFQEILEPVGKVGIVNGPGFLEFVFLILDVLPSIEEAVTAAANLLYPLPLQPVLDPEIVLLAVALPNVCLVDKVVVISPKNAFGSWKDEWDSCFGRLDMCRSLCFHDPLFANRSIAYKRRELSLNIGRYNLILLNYEAVGNYTEELSDIASSKTLLVFEGLFDTSEIEQMHR